MKRRGISGPDVEGTLLGGRYLEPEWECGVWRYRAGTERMGVVFEFANDDIVVVTAIRYEN